MSARAIENPWGTWLRPPDGTRFRAGAVALALFLVVPTPPTSAEEPPGGPAVVAFSEWAPIATSGASEADGEWVELLVEVAGNLGGLVITDNDGAQDFAFPDMLSAAGTRIVVSNGRAPPAGLAEGALVLFMNKTAWTWENTGDDLELRAPTGELLDRWSFAAGSAIDVPPADAPPLNGTWFALPPAGASLALQEDSAGAARPTPGAANALMERAPFAGLALAGVLQGGEPLAVVLCNELDRPFEAFGWTLANGSSHVPFPSQPVVSGGCVGWSISLPAAVIARLQSLTVAPSINWSATKHVPGPNASAALVALDPWGNSQRLAAPGSALAGQTSAVVWWEPCACDGGWRAVPFDAAPPVGQAHPVSDLRVAPAGSALASALASLVNSAVFWLSVNAYVLSDETVVDALARAAERGVSVRVLLEPRPVGWGALEGGLPPASRTSMEEAGVEVRAFEAGAPFAARTHAKYLVADGARFAVQTENFVSSALEATSPNTGYGVFGVSTGLAAELQRLFDWDWTMSGGSAPNSTKGSAPSPTSPAGSNDSGGPSASLIVSPGGGPAWGAWVDLVDNATSTVQVETLSADAQVLGPTAPIGAALLRAAIGGVRVTVLLAADAVGSTSGAMAGASLSAAAAASGASIEVRTDSRQPSNASKMHAKVLVVDASTFIIGSHNLVEAAFFANREVSLLVEDLQTAGFLSQQLDSDFEHASPTEPPDIALQPGGTLGTALGPGPSGASIPPTSVLLLLGGGGALTLGLLPRGRHLPRRRRRKRRPLKPADPDEIRESTDAPMRPNDPEGRVGEATFDLRVARVESPELHPPESGVPLPPSALERMRDGSG